MVEETFDQSEGTIRVVTIGIEDKIPNNQAPAYAEAASRRQANNQIITNTQVLMTEPLFGYWVIGIYLELNIWLLECR